MSPDPAAPKPLMWRATSKADMDLIRRRLSDLIKDMEKRK